MIALTIQTDFTGIPVTNTKQLWITVAFCREGCTDEWSQGVPVCES